MQSIIKTLFVGAILAFGTGTAFAADSAIGTWNLNVAKGTAEFVRGCSGDFEQTGRSHASTDAQGCVMLNAPRQDFASPVRAVETITASVMTWHPNWRRFCLQRQAA